MINIDNIMRNTFAVVTNRCEVDDILELYKGEDAMFYGNPLDMTVDDFDEVMLKSIVNIIYIAGGVAMLVLMISNM